MNRNLQLRTLAPAYLAMMIDSIGFGIVYPLMTELFAGEQGVHLAAGMSLSLRHFYLGLSFLLYPLTAFFSTSLMRDLSAIYGRKRIMIFCMGGICISFLLMGLGIELFSIPLLLIGRALSGFMAGSQPIAQASVIALSSPKAKAQNLMFLTVLISIGIVLGPLIGGIFSDTHLSRFFLLSTPFYIAALLAFIACVWIILSLPETLLTTTHRKSLNWMKPMHIFIEGFKADKIRLLVVVFFLMQAGFSLFYQLIQVFLSTVFDYSSWEIGVFNGYMGVAIAIVVLAGVKIFPRFWNVEKGVVYSLFFTAIFLFLSMLYPEEIFIWIAAFFIAGFDMAAYGMLMACFSNAAGKRDPGWAMGVYGSVVAATWALTGFSTNLIQFVGLRGLITFGGFFMLLSTIFMYQYSRKRV